MSSIFYLLPFSAGFVEYEVPFTYSAPAAVAVICIAPFKQNASPLKQVPVKYPLYDGHIA